MEISVTNHGTSATIIEKLIIVYKEIHLFIMENTPIRLLSSETHLLDKYWAMAYKDIIMKSNILQ